MIPMGFFLQRAKAHTKVQSPAREILGSENLKILRTEELLTVPNPISGDAGSGL